MQQRMRVAADAMQKDLVMAGAGTYSGVDGRDARQLLRADPAAQGRHHQPRPGRDRSRRTRSARTRAPRPSRSCTCRHQLADDDPATDMPTPSAELKVHQQPGCRRGRPRPVRVHRRRSRAHLRPERRLRHLHDHQRPGQRATPAASRRQVHAEVLRRRLDHEGRVAHLLPERSPGAPTPTSSATTTATRPICRSPTTSSISGSSSSAIRCRRRSSVRSADLVGPWTTYGPKPPAIGIDNDKDTWGAGENCIFHVDGTSGLQVARPQIQTLGTSLDGPVPLPASMLTDGPWCPAETSTDGDDMPNKFDADLLRVRQVRVTLRVQVANDVLRGPGRRALPPRRPVAAAASASSRTRKSASTSRRAT